MPYDRPGKAFYATNTSGGPINHGAPATEDNIVGVAVKQKSVSWKEGLAAQNVIAAGEDFLIITKGIVQVPKVSGFAVGDKIFIDPTTKLLTETSSSNLKFGRVVEIEKERGTPASKVRIDLDAKDSF